MVDQQNKELFGGIKKILLTSCKKKVFSNASIGLSGPFFSTPPKMTINCAETDKNRNVDIENSTFLFDLASLTKPLVSLLSILVLLERKKLFMDEPLDSLLNRKIRGNLKKVNLSNLLCHNSGLPAHIEYWRKLVEIASEKRKEWVIEKILSEKVSGSSLQKHTYSDLGYILLGYIVEEKSQKKLNTFWEENIAQPLGVEKCLNYPINFGGYKKEYIQTGVCPWSQRPLRGVVHDDNCRILGGVCGHAGLFGNVESVLTICQEMLNLLKGRKSKIPLTKATFSAACEQFGESEWTTGFNLPTVGDSSSGQFFSSRSIGHLGFTGTSFWIDPIHEIIVVLLTNRVFMGSDLKGIKSLRPEIHDYIFKKLKGATQQEKQKDAF